MGVDYSLYRVPVGLTLMELISEETVLPFGSQTEVLELLCRAPGFEHDLLRENQRQKASEWCREQDYESGDQAAWADVRYTYPNRKGIGRLVSYGLKDDPVTCFNISKTYIEDLWPVIQVFQSLTPLEMLTPAGGQNISEMPYSYKKWMQMNNEFDYVHQSDWRGWYESYF